MVLNPLCALALCLVLTGCEACLERAWSRGNSGAFERYAAKLQSSAGTSLKLERCAMFGMSRLGYCELRGAAPEVAKFFSAFSPAPDDPKTKYFKDGCANFPAFGTPLPATASHELKPGAQRAVPKGPLPSNTENVKLDAIAVDPSGERVCLELQFPFG